MNQPPTRLPIAVSAAIPELTEAATALARELDLPLAAIDDPRISIRLTRTAQRLELRMSGPDGPVHAEFLAGRPGYRRRTAGIRSEPIARAVGLAKGKRPTVIDACAGLGQDGFVLASLGCRVVMLERSPVIAALLRDGLKRAAKDPDTGPWLAQRLQLVQVDARDYLGQLPPDQRPEVVYLDPMYPARGNTALVKKELRALRAVAGDDIDSAELLAIALSTAHRRVVVKRHRLAPAIEGPEPSLTLPGRSSRFDIYLADNQ